jgi:hypothetical protein
MNISNKLLWTITGVLLAIPLLVIALDNRAAMQQCQLTHS